MSAFSFTFMKSETKKVLFFLQPEVGGAEKVTVLIAKMLSNAGYAVKFVILGKSKGKICQFIPSGYDVQLLRIVNMWDFLILKLTLLLKKEKPYAVFCSAMHYNSRLIIAAQIIGGIKIVIRNCNYLSNLRWDKMAMARLTYKKADWIIAQQEDMRKEIINTLPRLNPSKVVTLHNPIDKETIDKGSMAPNPFPDADNVNYVCVARFTPSKGQDVLAKAFVEVAKVNPKAHLWFIGRYDDKDDFVCRVKAILRDGDCIDSVHFVDYDSNPYRWMKYSDCFVLPSRREGLPNVLIEAQYLGIPCVATISIPLIDSIIIDGENGYKVMCDDYAAMSKAMVKAISLNQIKMTYAPADNNEFIYLF